MKTNWRLFHQIAPDAKHKQFLFGLNEYVTQQEAIDIALDTEPKLKQTYETYLALHDGLDGEETSRGTGKPVSYLRAKRYGNGHDDSDA